MKSIYIEERIHSQLKFLASLEKVKLTELVESFLEKGLERKKTDLPSKALQQLAQIGGSFDFLESDDEDIYSLKDGTPIK